MYVMERKVKQGTCVGVIDNVILYALVRQSLCDEVTFEHRLLRLSQKAKSFPARLRS